LIAAAAHNPEKFQSISENWIERAKTETEKERRTRISRDRASIVNEVSDHITYIKENNIDNEGADKIMKAALEKAELQTRKAGFTSKRSQERYDGLIKAADDKLQDIINSIEENVAPGTASTAEDGNFATETEATTEETAPETGETREGSSPSAYDFDDTLVNNETGELTDLGQQVQEDIANGEDVRIISARENTPENRKYIADKLGISEENIELVGQENQSNKKAAALDRMGIPRENFTDSNKELESEVRTGTAQMKLSDEFNFDIPTEVQESTTEVEFEGLNIETWERQPVTMSINEAVKGFRETVKKIDRLKELDCYSFRA